MASTSSTSPPKVGEPAWDIARLFPDQGFWDEEDYLALDTNRLVEFTDGCVEVLPMPKPSHQRIVAFLFSLLNAFVTPRKLGEVLFAPMPARLRAAKYREPDILLVLTEHSARKREKYWESPDLVIEVVSDDAESHRRDYEKKRDDYAEGGVTEYWIVDPQEQRITVLKLAGNKYEVHGEFGPDATATSCLLPGFEVSTRAVFAAGCKE